MAMDKEETTNETKWKQFLLSIKQVHVEKVESAAIKFHTRQANIKCLAYEFADKLLKDQTKPGEKDQTKPGEITIESEILTMNIQTNPVRQKKTKHDKEKSCCKWTVKMIAKYFDFDDTVRKHVALTDWNLSLQSFGLENHNFASELSKILSHLKPKLKIVKPLKDFGFNLPESENFVSDLTSIAVTENGCRQILDAFLFPLCNLLKLNIEVEKTITCQYLPNCRFDYCISKGDYIIGCVEAKSVSGFTPDAVAQTLIELMILQAYLISSEPWYSKCPLFAIVSDGHRFIYIQLIESVFEFALDCEKVKVQEITEEDDFRCIMEQIRYLMDAGATALDVLVKQLETYTASGQTQCV